MCRTQPRAPLLALATVLIAPLTVATACSDSGQSGDASPETDDSGPSDVVGLIASGQITFALFSGPTTQEQSELIGQAEELDLAFYSLESGPFDPLVLRIPPIRDGVETARANVAQALDADAAAIFFPHVESGEDAAVAIAAMGDDHWPGNPSGSLFSMLIVENRAGVDRVDEIVGTEGVSVVFAGPDDLQEAYEGDTEAAEAAVQTVLAACLSHGVPCGITAGVDDIAERIEQGFRVLIVSDVAGVEAGRAAVGHQSGDPAPDAAASEPIPSSPSPLVNLIAAGEVVFGIFPGPTTREQGALMGQNRELDFVFYSLESGPFDIVTTELYMAGIVEGSGAEPPHPLVLRIPPIRNGVEAARAYVAEALDAGVGAIVFPHVESGEDAAAAVAAMGDDHWPGNPAGSLFSILIVEDRSGVEQVEAIVGTGGVSVVFPGPGDLRRAYEGDMEAVEAAIQRVLAACQANGVPCGITAGVDDIAERIEQGFRMFIVTDAAAVTVGRAAAGR